MKKSKTVLLATSLFAAAVNINGCGVYGPPEIFDPSLNIAQPEYGAPYYVEPTVTVAPVEMDWYKLTKSRYGVLRVVSVPEELTEGETVPENAIYGVELLSFYAGDGVGLSGVSQVFLRWEDRHLFALDDVIFVEFGDEVQEDGALLYEVKYDTLGPVYNRFIDGKLVIWSEFKKHESYKYFVDFNGYIEWNYLVNQSGAADETTGEPVYFADGMTVEDAALFFTSIEKAKEAYEKE